MSDTARRKVPVLLLKTKSTPADVYEDFFGTLDQGTYLPTFVPVLEHRFKQEALSEVSQFVLDGRFAQQAASERPRYGAIIFTSQRAVEAFSQVIQDIGSQRVDMSQYFSETTPFYVVGPATARGLRALRLPCPILGEETGNGEALATFILEHYNSLHSGSENPVILFLVGEKRRDIIPNTLQINELLPDQRCVVDELVVYETGEMQAFKGSFDRLWQENQKLNRVQWIVVFSPTGCQAMLESLGILDPMTGVLHLERRPKGILVATIGPTTRDYLVKDFGFVPDVCANQPSPEGIAAGIEAYHASRAGDLNHF